jgi:hypothetical protein
MAFKPAETREAENFRKSVLREMFMSEGKELAGCCRKLRYWKIHDSFWSTNAIAGDAKEGEMVGEHLEFLWREEEAMQGFLSKM